MTPYCLLSYQEGPTAVAGLLVRDRIYRAESVLRRTNLDASSVLSLLETWPETHRILLEVVGDLRPDDGAPLDRAVLLAPILYPRGVFCAGANYWDHLEEMARTQNEPPVDRSRRAQEPWFFLKTAAHSIVGDGAPVKMPRKTVKLDWEAELGVVVGRRAWEVTAERAVDVIAGFTIVNDLSARDLMTRGDRPPAMTYDWVGQKCFDGSAPMGPWITPAPFIENCHNLDVRLWVNGALKQSSSTSQLIHNVYEQIEWLSHQLTLLPGDVIATGTPAGVGMPSGNYLKKGDVVKIEIEKCGELTNRII